MKISQLKSSLDSLQHILVDVNAKGAAKEFAKLTELLGEHEGETVTDFVSKVRKALNGKAAPKPARTSLPRVDLIKKYADKLSDPELSQEDFEQLMTALGADRKIRNIELFAIANQYLGAEINHKSKAQAIKSIRQKFIGALRDKKSFKAMEKTSWWGSGN